MENFTRKPWIITDVVPPSQEVEGHQIRISGTIGPRQAKVICKDHRSYPDGTYHPGPPETISDGATYAITHIPGRPNEPNEITYADLPGMAGSWTADDSPSPTDEE